MARYVGLMLFLFAAGLFSPVSHADTFVAAWHDCQQYIASHGSSSWDPSHCEVASVSGLHRVDGYMSATAQNSAHDAGYLRLAAWFYYDSDFCQSGQVSPVNIFGWSGGAPGPYYSNVGSCQCVVFNQVAYSPDFSSLSAMCQLTGNQYGDYSGQDPPSSSPPVTDNSPRPCDGGSCYDPQTNQFCAVDGSGKQVCVGGPNQNPPDKGKTPQYCGLGDGVAVCAGTPDSPAPVGQFTDPTGTTHVFAPDDSGGTWTTVVNVYDTTGQGNNANPGDGSTSTGTTGNTGNNGSQGKADSAGQCADGSTPSAGGCGAGYADRGCDAPPTCSGDPLLCASIKEQHATRCAAAKRGQAADDRRSDLLAAAQDSDARGAGGDDISPGDAWAGGVVGGSGDGDGDGSADGDADGDGMLDLEVTRYWGGQATCPGIPDVIPGLAMIAQDTLCLYAGKLAALLLAMGYVLGTLAFAKTVSS